MLLLAVGVLLGALVTIATIIFISSLMVAAEVESTVVRSADEPTNEQLLELFRDGK